MAAILSLCGRVLALREGKLVFDGLPSDGISQYLHGDRSASCTEIRLEQAPREHSHDKILIRTLMLTDASGTPKAHFAIGEPIRFRLKLHLKETLLFPHVGIGINSALGTRVTTLLTRCHGVQPPPLQGTVMVECTVRDLLLAPGTYGLKLGVGSGVQDLDLVEVSNAFEVVPSDLWGSGKLPAKKQGVILATAEWEFQK